VIDLLAGVRDYVYPVGRLDYETGGLLILTNDGDLAARLTHPRHGVARVYEAKVLGVPDAHDLERLSRGVTVEGQRMTATSVRVLPSRNDRHATLQITIHEGRNRQVRNMLEAIGHPVDQLTRIAIGPIRDAKLKLGRWRDLTDAEVKSLKKLSAAAESQRPQLHRGGHRGHGEPTTHRPPEKKSGDRRGPQRRRSR
jgi:pseudouridine synthase